MSSHITLSKDLKLPAANAASQVYAFMGRRGSGKTYGAGRLVEQLDEQEGQFCIVDPVGVWWGLRLAADGKSQGLEVPVFGGQHGDLPLPHIAGKVFAEMLATRSTSMVLDVSDMTITEQRTFVGEFAAELFQAKKRHKSPVLVLFEECQEFVPQHVIGEQAKMVSAMQRLVKLGRNYGIGAALISQRPQAVNKDVLNQTEVMLAFQLTGPQERKAIAGWVQEVGAGDRDIADELPGLKTGHCVAWSPSWLGHFGRHQIAEKWTYDASATPEGRRAEAAKQLPALDIEEIKAAIEAAKLDVVANDPKALKAEVARLTRALQAEISRKPAEVAGPKVVEVPFVPKAVIASFRLKSTAAIRSAAKVGAAFRQLDEDLTELQAYVNEIELQPVRTKGVPTASAAARPAPPVRRTTPAGPSFGGDGTDWRPSGGALRILEALATSMADGMTWRQLATLAGMKPTGGGFQNYKSALRSHGCVEERGDRVFSTAAGRAWVPDASPPPAGPELVAFWQQRLPGKAGLMLQTVLDQGPISKAELAAAVEMDAGGGGFNNYLSTLRSNGLIENVDGGLGPAEVFLR